MGMKARKTTLAHMQRLAASAALATNVACDSTCGSGYAVVDPMPTPGRIKGNAASVHAKATFGDAGTTIVVEVEDPTTSGVTLTAMTAPDASSPGYSVSGARVVDVKVTSKGLRFELEPSPSRGALYLQLEIDGVDAGAVEAAVAWGTTADGGRSLSVTMSDR
jgi:hypothetical protein